MEEIKDPLVNLPRAVLIDIPIVMILYVCVNIAYLTVLSPEELVASQAVAVVLLYILSFKMRMNYMLSLISTGCSE